MVYELKLVGGPYDGAHGLVWREGRGFELPDTILVGVCSCAGDCTGSARLCPGTRHVAYWLPEEEELLPEETATYELFRAWTDRGHGTAEYTIPGLQLPRAETLADRVAVPA